MPVARHFADYDDASQRVTELKWETPHHFEVSVAIVPKAGHKFTQRDHKIVQRIGIMPDQKGGQTLYANSTTTIPEGERRPWDQNTLRQTSFQGDLTPYWQTAVDEFQRKWKDKTTLSNEDAKTLQKFVSDSIATLPMQPDSPKKAR